MSDQQSLGQSLPPPAAPSPTRLRKPKRPAFAVVAILVVLVRVGRDVLPGWWGAIVSAAFFIALVSWRLLVRHRARRAGVAELTPDMVRRQLTDSGVAPPAFVEDGSLLGASVLVVNQRSKLIEVITEYEIFDSQGLTLGHVSQIGQGRFKKVARFLGPWDQFMTHHFDITDRAGQLVLRLTRPRKVFRSRLEVFDGQDRFVGRIVQDNVFGKIHFGIYSATGERLGRLGAQNWRAWDFRIELSSGVEVAHVTKTWEGLARTMVTNADHYVVRVHQVLGEPMRALTIAAALTVDLALKQDARGLGG